MPALISAELPHPRDQDALHVVAELAHIAAQARVCRGLNRVLGNLRRGCRADE